MVIILSIEDDIEDVITHEVYEKYINYDPCIDVKYIIEQDYAIAYITCECNS